MAIFNRKNLTQWIGGGIVGMLISEGAHVTYERFQQFRQSARWVDPLFLSLAFTWTVPAIFTYFFARKYLLDGRAEPALVRIWFGGMTVMFLAIGYVEIITGKGEILVTNLKQDPLGVSILFFAASFGLMHSIFRAVLTGDGAERRRRRVRPKQDDVEGPTMT
jgi:hypothetical protein